MTDYVIFINNINYTDYVSQGFVINETLTEELDSATLILNYTKTAFEPFDEVRIIIGNKIYYFLINTYQERMLAENVLYQYTLQLVSQTKLLEKVYLPNLAITKPNNTASTKTIYNYLNYTILPYIKKQFPNITISNNLKNMLGNITCPEMEWTTPTAKQVINDLLSTISNNPCLCKLVNMQIDYLQLNKKGNPIDADNVASDERYNQMENYANNMILDVKNAYTEKISVSPILTARASGGAYQLTTDNVAMVVPNVVIDRLKKVVVYVDINILRQDTTKEVHNNYALDITNYIVEESVYNILNTAQSYGEEIGEGDEWKKYKRWHLYFTQGSNEIKGMNFIEGTASGGLRYTAFQNICKKEILRIFDNTTNPIKQTNWNNVPNFTYDTKYEIYYYPLGNFKAKVFKKEALDTDITFTASQPQQAINYESLNNVCNDNLNRIGNPIRIIDKVCKISDLPNLNDYIGNYILINKEVAYKGEYALFKGTLSKDYVQKTIFAGVNMKTRFTQIVQSGGEITREELLDTRIYLETTNRSQTDAFLTKVANHYTNATQTGNLEYEKTRWVNAIYVETYDYDNEKIANFILIPDTYNGANQFTISAKCQDNYTAGMMREVEGVSTYQNYYSYVDNNGECYKVKTALITNLSEYNANKLPELDIEDSDIEYNDYLLESEFVVNKDNKEALKFTYQISFLTTQDNVVIGNKLGWFNPLIANATFKLKYNPNGKLDTKYPAITSDWVEVNTTLGNRSNCFYFSSSVVKNSGSWCIVSPSDEVLFGVNEKDGLLPQRIYFNMERR